MKQVKCKCKMYHLQQAKKTLNTNESTLEILLTAMKFCSNYHGVP